jgi:hypothetical protein
MKVSSYSSHPSSLRKEENQRAPPAAIPDYAEPIETFSYDERWSDYEEPVFGGGCRSGAWRHAPFFERT